ncbi:MAG: hypothetical protein ACR2OA_09840 [Rubripirellula sp.]|jgi:hypothetical protein
MSRPHPLLTSTILDYSARCTNNERRAIVAYCCHLAFSDKSIRRQEVDFVEAIANEMEVDVHELRKMARKARRRRLKIKTPTSRGARNLLFHLAMRTAISDTRTDARERSALEHLAKQLRIPSEVVDREIQKLQQKFTLPSEPPPQPALLESKTDQLPENATGIIESLTQNMVTEHLRANLSCPESPSASPATAELIYTLTSKGETELELEGDGFHLPAGEKFLIYISDHHVCELTSPLNQHTQPIKLSRQNCPQHFIIGGTVVIRHRDTVLLSGTLAPNE